VRNAIDHGIEDEYERVALRKPSGGNVRIAVSNDGRDYLVDVSDDGRGIDFDRVRRKALDKGVLAPGQVGDRAALVKLLFSPDFSCSEGTALSGRGYGLDIVRETVVRLHGQVSVATKNGIGTRFRIRIPQKTQTAQEGQRQ
jgi:two-component system chemotaxis sensor kinase CheA